MPNLKDIRRRIKSVKSTQKITQAMKMVAAAKVKRAENRVKAARPYASELHSLMHLVYEALVTKGMDISQDASRYLSFLSPRPVKNLGILVISSDRGLCGNYNSTIIRQAFQLEKALREKGVTPKFYLVGNKVIQSFSRYSNSELLGSMGGITAAPTVQESTQIAQTLINAYLNQEIDGIEVLSTHFVSMISTKAEMTKLIPVSKISDEEIIEQNNSKHLQSLPGPIHPELMLLPNPSKMLDTLMPMYLGNMIYRLLLEGAASELAARMTAMSNATKNAGEMIDKLTTVYNKLRQASITQEILEIVGGAEALK
ncbi:MAG: ATP synthase F1 subunit gamma [Vampirovibrionales bacterium]|nr:ATP synthase F1 subunit gamma [Vampirovibrionales bacterium]